MARYIYPETTPPLPHLEPYEMTEAESLERMRRREKLAEPEPEREPQPGYEPRVIGVTEEGRPIVQQMPIEGAFRVRTTVVEGEPQPRPRQPTVTEQILPYTGGFLGGIAAVTEEQGRSIWSLLTGQPQPDVPDPVGAYLSTFVGSLRVKPEKPRLVGGKVLPALGFEFTPSAELKELWKTEEKYPGYTMGAMAGEVGYSLLTGWVAGKVYEKGAALYHKLKAPKYEVYWKLEQAIPEEEMVPSAFKIEPFKGVPSQPPSSLSRGAERLLVQQVQKEAETLVPSPTAFMGPLETETTKQTAKQVSQTIAGLGSAVIGQLPKAWQTQPYPGTKVKIREEYETVVYHAPKSIQDFVRETQVTRPQKLKAPQIGKVGPFIGTIPERRTRQDLRVETVLDVKTVQRQMEKQAERQLQAMLPRYAQLTRGKPMVPRLDFEWPKRRPRGRRGRFGGAWFLREYPIRLPTDIMGLKPSKRKRRKKRR